MKKTPSVKFTFIDPNSPAVFEETLRKILLEKLLSKFSCPEALPAAG